MVKTNKTLQLTKNMPYMDSAFKMPIITKDGIDGFNSDEKWGALGEAEVRRWIEKTTTWKFHGKSTGDDIKKFDLVFITTESKYITVEVKTDYKLVKGGDSGNIYIETYSRGIASGITTTKAKIFITYFPLWGEIYMAKTKDLKDNLEKSGWIGDRPGGDDGTSRGYLIPRSFVQNSLDKLGVCYKGYSINREELYV